MHTAHITNHEFDNILLTSILLSLLFLSQSENNIAFSIRFNVCHQIILTLLSAKVPLAHHKTPPENSDAILCLSSVCLKSDNFNSFINTEICDGICSSSNGTKVSTSFSSSTPVEKQCDRLKSEEK